MNEKRKQDPCISSLDPQKTTIINGKDFYIVPIEEALFSEVLDILSDKTMLNLRPPK